MFLIVLWIVPPKVDLLWHCFKRTTLSISCHQKLNGFPQHLGSKLHLLYHQFPYILSSWKRGYGTTQPVFTYTLAQFQHILHGFNTLVGYLQWRFMFAQLGEYGTVLEVHFHKEGKPFDHKYSILQRISNLGNENLHIVYNSI